MGNCRVVIVDNDAFTRATLAAALSGKNFEVVAAVGKASQCLALPDLNSVHVALLDLDLGDGPTGLDLAKALRERYPKIGIVLLTTYDDPRLVASNLPPLPKGGIHLRKRDVHEMKVVAKAVLEAATKPVSQRSGPGADGPTLTQTQNEVLRDVVQGLSNAQIAEKRGTSNSAVEKMVARIAERLGISPDDGNVRVILTQEYLKLTGKLDAGE